MCPTDEQLLVKRALDTSARVAVSAIALVAIFALGLALSATSSSASTLSRSDTFFDSEGVFQIKYDAGPGETNLLTVRELVIRGQRWIRVTDHATRVRIRLSGRGCQPDRPTGVQARRIPAGGGTVYNPRSGATAYCSLADTSTPPGFVAQATLCACVRRNALGR